MAEILKRILWGLLPVIAAALVWLATKPADDLSAREHQASAPIESTTSAPEVPAAVQLALDELGTRIETNDDGARVRHEVALMVYARGLDSVKAEIDQLRTEVEKLRAEAGKFRAVAAAPKKTGTWDAKVTRASGGPELRGGLK